jgi:ATP/maltotriose-dependent transcriptional regulator MalT
VMYNSLGRYADALEAAERATEYPEDMGFFQWGKVELIEAAVRSDQPKRARDVLQSLSDNTRASGTDWALGIEARSQALVSDGGVADRLYRESIERLGRTRVRGELARAHLLYGEWLRRERRRVDAREQLRAAHEMLDRMGAEAFTERARRELMATGETVRKRTVETRDELTSQERQIAYLARDGLSNPDIAARLFISPRTVQYHLRKVFSKLDITSRNQLGRALPRDPVTALAS